MTATIRAQISECVEALKCALPAEEIWLFGSQARGTAGKGSDIDLLVIVPDNHGLARPHLAATRAISRLRKPIDAEVAIFPHSALQRKPLPVLVKEALAGGQRLYGRAR